MVNSFEHESPEEAYRSRGRLKNIISERSGGTIATFMDRSPEHLRFITQLNNDDRRFYDEKRWQELIAELERLLAIE